MLGPDDRRRVEQLLAEAQARGALGPAPVRDHLVHGAAMAEVIGTPPPSCCDLGSGGGVPALVLAFEWPRTHFTLVEAMAKRARWLEHASGQLGIAGRCVIVHDRAEVVGRDPVLRESFDMVTARSFGAPPVTAECAAPFLRTGGRLVVSEPPKAEASRWPTDGLTQLGFGPPERRLAMDGEGAFVVIEKVAPTPERFPRRVGVPQKRPLWQTTGGAPAAT